MTQPGGETIRGRYVGPGAECPQFRLDSGETISLSSIRDADLTPGQPVVLQGSWQRISRCMQGREFRVEAVTAR